MNTIKQHLEAHGFEVVTPTPGLIKHWWRRCLKEVFGYPLLPMLVPATVEIRKQTDEWAACHWPERWTNSRLHLTHHNDPISRNGLLTILLHEIVHAILTYESRHDDTPHGERFMAYAALVECETGLPFQDRYSREHIEGLGRKLKRG